MTSMIDPSRIDERIAELRALNTATCEALRKEIARLPVVVEDWPGELTLHRLSEQLRSGRLAGTGKPPGSFIGQEPDPGSFANQLFSAICSMVDARAELILLELCASPDFYAAMMRSAAEQPVDPAA